MASMPSTYKCISINQLLNNKFVERIPIDLDASTSTEASAFEAYERLQ